jgi:hypothetical protein
MFLYEGVEMVIKGAIIVLLFVACMAFLIACLCIATQEDEEMEEIRKHGNYACYNDDDDD